MEIRYRDQKNGNMQFDFVPTVVGDELHIPAFTVHTNFGDFDIRPEVLTDAEYKWKSGGRLYLVKDGELHWVAEDMVVDAALEPLSLDGPVMPILLRVNRGIITVKRSVE